MPNPYTNIYMPNGFDQNQGLTPVFQNIAQQQANQNAALAQQNQQVQQAGQTTPQGGNNALALAQMLRKPKNDFSNPVLPYDANSLSNPYAQTDLYGAN